MNWDRIIAVVGIVVGLIPVILEKRGIAVSIWWVNSGGVVVILGLCYCLYYPIEWLLRKFGLQSSSSVSSQSVSLAVLSAFGATLIVLWLLHGSIQYDTPQWQDRTQTISKRSYANETVEVDGKTFSFCSFTNVTLLYRGTGDFRFIGAKFYGTIIIETDNKAAKGIMLLQAMLKTVPHIKYFMAEKDASGKMRIIQEEKGSPPSKPTEK